MTGKYNDEFCKQADRFKIFDVAPDGIARSDLSGASEAAIRAIFTLQELLRAIDSTEPGRLIKARKQAENVVKSAGLSL